VFELLEIVRSPATARPQFSVASSVSGRIY
jgi:hypothetical protein